MIIVKPALPCLDILYRVRQSCNLPIAAYQVSSEYSMIKAAGQNGWIDELAMMEESRICIKRAGADMIITYFSSDLLETGIIK